MEKKDLICICCPLGCQCSVDIEDGKVVNVSGNTCKRGEEYAKKEFTNPTRMVTTTVKVLHGKDLTASVKTKTDIPKNLIFDCVRALKDTVIEAPVNIGDVVIENVSGTGVDIIASCNVAKI